MTQGTREYFETILDKMRDRAIRNGDTAEFELADRLAEAMDTGKVEYVVVKAKSDRSQYAGYVLKKFHLG